MCSGRESGCNIRVKAPGTPTITTFPLVGMMTAFSGEVSQTEAGAAGSFDPTVMAIIALVIILDDLSSSMELCGGWRRDGMDSREKNAA